MSLLVAIVGAVFAFFIIVLIHECGHFFVARLLNVKVLQFSIGFGKAIYSRVSNSGVEFAIRMLPLGGYVQMDDGNLDAQDKGSSGEPLPSRPIWVRVLVVLAGPFVNLVLAVLLLWALYVMGVTEIKPVVGKVIPQSIADKGLVRPGDQITQVDGWKTHNWQQVLMSIFMQVGDEKPLLLGVRDNQGNQQAKSLSMQNWRYDAQNPALLQSIGIIPKRPKIDPIIATVVAGSPAQGKLEPRDMIISINGQSVVDWAQFVRIVQENPEKMLRLVIIRNHHKQVVSVKAGAHKVGDKYYGFLGISPRMPKIPADLKIHVQYSLLTGWQPALSETWRLIVFHFVAIKQMVLGRVSLKSLGGPISVFKTAGQASQAGVKVYLSFLALISIVIGILNLLPIPGLDGGHLLFYVIEAVIRRPIPEKLQYVITAIGIFFLIFLMSYATLNDLLRLFF